MKRRQNTKAFLLLFTGMLTGFGPFMTDFYLPAFPQLQTYFGTTISFIQLSLTFGMIGLAGGQLIFGPLSDKYGRRNQLVISLGIFVFSTLICMLSGNIHLFLLFRLLQGISAGGGVVIARSVAVDLYEGRELSRFFSLLAAIQGVAPIVAPILGGLLLNIMDWRGIFGILLLLGVFLLTASTFQFRESLPLQRRITDLRQVFKAYLPILRNKRFMRYVLTQSTAFAVLFAYIAASPFIFQSHYRLSPTWYSLCFALNAGCAMMGSFLVARFPDERKALIRSTQVFAGVSVLTAFLLIAQLPLWTVEGALILLSVSFGCIMPPTTSLALDMERNNSGNASAVLGFSQFLFGAVVSPLVGIGDVLVSTGLIIGCMSLLTWWICPKFTVLKS